jgi:hypothetical protein
VREGGREGGWGYEFETVDQALSKEEHLHSAFFSRGTLIAVETGMTS